MQLGFGAAIRWRLGPLLFGEGVMAPGLEALPVWIQWLALPVAAAAFEVLFWAHPRHHRVIRLLGITSHNIVSTYDSFLGPS